VAVPVVARRAVPAAGRHGYGAVTVGLFLRLVLEAGVSLRAVPRVLSAVSSALGLGLAVPHWTTGRLWLLRVGHARLTQPLTPADDWAWLVDHSVQVGTAKCLVILGVRLSRLPLGEGEGRGPLRHHDLALVALEPADHWTRPDVDAALERATARTGGRAPRVIVSDRGPDVAGGVALFQQRHPGTADVYDVKHKAACLLKARLNESERHAAFLAGVGRTRHQVRQTELAFAAPPVARTKARFMNLGADLAWGVRAAALVRRSLLLSQSSTPTPTPTPTPALALAGQVRHDRLVEKLGWVSAFESDLTEWSRWQAVADVATAQGNQHGLDRDSARRLAAALRPSTRPAAGPRCPTTRQLSADLLRFTRHQQRHLRPGERLPASTEALESCFGRFKQLERQQSRGGFTQLLLAFGAMLGTPSPAAAAAAMAASRTRDVREWATNALGQTLTSLRRRLFTGATNTA